MHQTKTSSSRAAGAVLILLILMAVALSACGSSSSTIGQRGRLDDGHDGHRPRLPLAARGSLHGAARMPGEERRHAAEDHAGTAARVPRRPPRRLERPSTAQRREQSAVRSGAEEVRRRLAPEGRHARLRPGSLTGVPGSAEEIRGVHEGKRHQRARTEHVRLRPDLRDEGPADDEPAVQGGRDQVREPAARLLPRRARQGRHLDRLTGSVSTARAPRGPGGTTRGARCNGSRAGRRAPRRPDRGDSRRSVVL